MEQLGYKPASVTSGSFTCDATTSGLNIFTFWRYNICKLHTPYNYNSVNMTTYALRNFCPDQIHFQCLVITFCKCVILPKTAC